MTIRQAVSSDTESIIRLIPERMSRMEQNGIRPGIFGPIPRAFMRREDDQGELREKRLDKLMGS